MKKLTNVLALEMVLALEEVKGNQELFDKLTTMKNQFDKKNKSASGEKKPTKAQQENEIIKETILDVLATFEEPKQIKELQTVEELKDFSNQKLSALFRQLVAENKVERIEEKSKTLFKIVVDNN